MPLSENQGDCGCQCCYSVLEPETVSGAKMVLARSQRKAGAGSSCLGGEGDRGVWHGCWLPPEAGLDVWAEGSRCEGGWQGGSLWGLTTLWLKEPEPLALTDTEPSPKTRVFTKSHVFMQRWGEFQYPCVLGSMHPIFLRIQLPLSALTLSPFSHLGHPRLEGTGMGP